MTDMCRKDDINYARARARRMRDKALETLYINTKAGEKANIGPVWGEYWDTLARLGKCRCPGCEADRVFEEISGDEKPWGDYPF